MKIALLTPTFSHFSGIDRVVERDALEFSEKGDFVAVFALKATISVKGVTIIELGMPKNPFVERLYRLLFFLDRKKIKKYGNQLKDYDKIISYFYPICLS